MKVFEVSVRSDFAEWERYNVFLTAVCAVDGEVADYVNVTERPLELITPPCDSADLYVYVVAREFPASETIAASPPFDVTVIVTADYQTTTKTYPVNQFGGLSIKQTLQ